MGLLNLGFIKKRRQELNLSLQEMAESLGFKNASTYMKYEEGSYAFKANHLPILANKLDGKIEDFFIENFAEIAKLEHYAIKEVI